MNSMMMFVWQTTFEESKELFEYKNEGERCSHDSGLDVRTGE